MVKIYHRKTQQVIEQAGYQDGLLQKLYYSSWGKFFLPWITFPLFSSLITIWDYSPFSKKKISDFVQNYQIDLNQFERKEYNNFAQFFTRKFKENRRPLFEMNQVLAVADAKLQIFSVHQERTVTIKGQDYTLADLLQDANLAKEFEGGTLCLYRLGIEDYHRYISCETGDILCKKNIAGKLHTIRQLAQEIYPVFKENKRCLTLIDSQYGKVVQMEIGALLVGRIYNHPLASLVKGQEKGFFGLGGSSIIVLYPKDSIELDQDIWHYSQQDIEIQVSLGERIGTYV